MAGVVLALALPGDAEGLARVTADEDVDGLAERDSPAEVADVVEDGDTGEPLSEDSLAGRVLFAHPGVSASDGKVESADP